MCKLPSAPHWIGWRAAADKRPAGLVAVTTQSKLVEEDGRRAADLAVSAVHDLANETTLVLDQKVTTFLLDRAGRLWLGADKGEWGGSVARVDTSNGSVVEIKPPPTSACPNGENSWEGVYGFVERADGQVWAFGGTSHMGMNSAFITRVDQPNPRRLFTFETPPDRGKQPDTNRPSMPITHVIEENSGLFVLSFSDVFRVDSIASHRGNRPPRSISDIAGAVPTPSGLIRPYCAIHPPRHKGEGYLFATVGDGYVSLDGAKAAAHSIPGQLGASGVHEIKNTSEGNFLLRVRRSASLLADGRPGLGNRVTCPTS